tara:strand:+ start:189 stop:392 length:204 start_codon:yes stop_codon:yes gene_type:complete
MDAFYETANISYKTLNIFEAMYIAERGKIIVEIEKIFKEKYNIDINTDGTKAETNNILAADNSNNVD